MVVIIPALPVTIPSSTTLAQDSSPGVHSAKMEEIPDVYPPSKLGEYTVMSDIAEGTFGKVKLAVHTVTGHRVAMKFISKQVINQTRTKPRVQREVDYMRTLRHPHIIKLYEVISTPTDIIIVLEFAGGELFNYIVANGKMPERQARKFFQQLISGIDYSHRLKIVHRDLKPENVLLDDDLNVKIADFGLSNKIADGDFLKTSCGSPNYAAPEVIRGGLYTGPEIDVWSCGVILYVMLCGRLPFEDDDVQTLFTKISQGSFHIPSSLSPDAKNLITGMLAVDPVKRITVPQILEHPYFTTDLPRYLSPLPPPPGPIIGMSTLVTPAKPLDFEIIDGLGRIEEDVVEDDGPQGNKVKIAYLLLRDKHRLGHDLAEFMERERDAELAARDPRNPISPNALSPGGEDDDLDLDFSTPQNEAENSTFAVLNSSLPFQLPEQHHLASYVNAKRAYPIKEKKQHRTRWHFGIRSRSPPMEVMYEIYKTLDNLGMEWKAKGDLGGLGGVRPRERERRNTDRKVERAREYDGGGYVDFRAASSIYFIETRTRYQDVVVLMNVQLYMVDSINYLVDFHHKRTYKAAYDAEINKFAMAHPDFNLWETASIESTRSMKEVGSKEEEVISPFVFMDVACNLILELAGGGGSNAE
ncbi:hypothetical protein NLI96_g2035 [Meripilus lineatus]|uniref:non-specific serine/threonine protein kinase n=1 Tax=Meripilus lineatus TaxID=2056292 RepID=A0AAD5V9H8_9APHY|nr:hypothetical protein NLI96_g2035 [Physisporinus lineatus]